MGEEFSLKSQLEQFLNLHVADPDAILIGGQALATWVQLLGVPIPTALEAGVSADLDYLAGKKAASEHRVALLRRGYSVEMFLPELGDFTPNAAKLVVRQGDDPPVEIDFMAEMFGFNVQEKERVSKRAVPVEIGGLRLQVMHPFDCLKSRISNLAGLSAKQNEHGLAQLRLAMDVCMRFLALNCGDPKARRNILFPVIQRVVELARSRHGMAVLRTWGIDALDAIPYEAVGGDFQEKRWPQILDQMKRKRFGRRGGNKRFYGGLARSGARVVD